MEHGHKPRPRQRVPQVHHVIVVGTGGIRAQEQQYASPRAAVVHSIYIGPALSCGTVVGDPLPERFVGKRGLGFERDLHHLHDKQGRVEAGPALRSRDDKQGQERTKDDKEDKQPAGPSEREPLQRAGETEREHPFVTSVHAHLSD